MYTGAAVGGVAIGAWAGPAIALATGVEAIGAVSAAAISLGVATGATVAVDDATDSSKEEKPEDKIKK